MSGREYPRRDWPAISPSAVSKCSEAHITFLLEDAKADIAELSEYARELLETAERLLAELWDNLHSGMGREEFERQYASELAAIAKARGAA
jgi:hypothetical protein